MNAESYLRKQGWKGAGHSLDTTGRGIKKPLLIAHKQDQLGLGKKKAAWTTDDQWWMRAFDQSLQSIGTGQESTLSQIRTKGINRGGLYGFFVKGEAIAGTIQESSASATDASVPPSGASTPPTSASDNEAPAATKAANKKDKRKRDDGRVSKKIKKVKSSKNDKAYAEISTTKVDAAADRRIAKMSSREKKECEDRAAQKDQSLHDYVVRRIQKKTAKRANR
ncbi:hypothetical protein ACEQ8H_004824 [Pleosporales sp. CAS-2024a]